MGIITLITGFFTNFKTYILAIVFIALVGFGGWFYNKYENAKITALQTEVSTLIASNKSLSQQITQIQNNSAITNKSIQSIELNQEKLTKQLSSMNLVVQGTKNSAALTKIINAEIAKLFAEMQK